MRFDLPDDGLVLAKAGIREPFTRCGRPKRSASTRDGPAETRGEAEVLASPDVPSRLSIALRDDAGRSVDREQGGGKSASVLRQ